MEREELDFIQERYGLVRERIRNIKDEQVLADGFGEFFTQTSAWLAELARAWDYVGSDKYKEASLEELRKLNKSLYAPAMKENYDNTFLNPAYAVKHLGEEYGRMLSFLASELFGMIPCVYERKLYELTIRMELFVEVYSAFIYAYEETNTLPPSEEIRKIIYWFVSDYQDVALEERIGEQLGINRSIADGIVFEGDLNDLRYLYRYGEYVTDNEERLAQFMNSLPEEEIKRMADTYTEGYRIGFETTNKDISKKKTVAVYYQLGFERLINILMENGYQIPNDKKKYVTKINF